MNKDIEDIKQAINMLHKENMATLQFLQVVLQAQGVSNNEIGRIRRKIEKSSNETENLFITKED